MVVLTLQLFVLFFAVKYGELSVRDILADIKSIHNQTISITTFNGISNTTGIS